MSEHEDLDGGAEGAAVLPLIPEELGVHPLLLAVMHSIVFLDGSTEDCVKEDAAEEAVNYLATYLQRLKGADLLRMREDMDCLISYARTEKWPNEVIEFLTDFLEDFGIGGTEE